MVEQFLPKKLSVKNMLTKILPVGEIKQSMALLIEKPKLQRRLPPNIEPKHPNFQLVEILVLLELCTPQFAQLVLPDTTIIPRPLRGTKVNCGSHSSVVSSNVKIGDFRSLSGSMRIGYHYRRHRLNPHPSPLLTSTSMFRELSLPARNLSELTRLNDTGMNATRTNALWIESGRNYAI
jgi:hypothetical protein